MFRPGCTGIPQGNVWRSRQVCLYSLYLYPAKNVITREEIDEDVDNVCTVRMISSQIIQDGPKLLVKETSKDEVLTQVMQCVKEAWPNRPPGLQETGRFTIH